MFDVVFRILVLCLRVDTWSFVFFFKQKTAYEMRISDWSSDVCSSDLPVQDESALRCRFVRPGGKKSAGPMVPATRFVGKAIRSEERRVGKECVVRVDLGGRRILKKKKKKK